MKKENSNPAIPISGQVLEDENHRHPTRFTDFESPTCHAMLPSRTSAFQLLHAFGIGIGPMTTVLSTAAILVAWLFCAPLGLMV